MRHTVVVVIASVFGACACSCASFSERVSERPLVVEQGHAPVASCADQPPLDRALVVANYNIKSGLWSSLDDVTSVVKGLDADIVALEEVDRHMDRSGAVDEAAVIASAIDAEAVFAGTWDRGKGSYGVALLSKLPIVSVERFDLPRAWGFEPRVAIDAVVCAGTTPVRVIAAHADFLPWAAAAQAEAIAARVGADKDVVVLGDFNASPAEDGVKVLKGDRVDAVAEFDEGVTFPGLGNRIDYILTGHKVTSAKRIASPASDHYAVTATLDLGHAVLAALPAETTLTTTLTSN